MSERSWKKFERRVAGLFGVRRIPVTGERAGADLENELFVVQAKLGRAMPAYLQEWLDGIVAAGLKRRPAKIGLVVWKPRRTHDRSALVICRLEDWIELHGPVARATEGGSDAASPVS